MLEVQWKKRIKIFEFIYAHLVCENNCNQMVEKFIDENPEFDADFLKVIEYISENIDNIINDLKPFIASNWSWERISYVDKSILICAVAEYRVLETPRNIIIDQALITGRNYNIDDSYKFINPILEKVLK